MAGKPFPGYGKTWKRIPEWALNEMLGGNGKQRGEHCPALKPRKSLHRHYLKKKKTLFIVCSISDWTNSVALRTKKKITIQNETN